MQASMLLEGAPSGTRLALVANAALSLLGLVLPSVLRGPLLWLFGASLPGTLRGNLLALPCFWLLTPAGGGALWGIISLLLAFVTALSYFPRIEQELGTLRFAAWLFVVSGVISLLFLPLTLLLAQVSGSWYVSSCAGLWPLLAVAMTSSGLAAPRDATTSLLGLVPVPARWAPLALVGFFALTAGPGQVLSLLIGWVVAVGAHQASGGEALHPKLAWLRLPLHMALPSKALAASLEGNAGGSGGGQQLGGASKPGAAGASGALAAAAAAARGAGKRLPPWVRQHYIPASAAGRAGDGSGGGEVAGGDNRSAAAASSASGGGRSFVAFGGPGQRLGGSSGAEV